MELTIEIIRACKMTALSCRKCVLHLSQDDPVQIADQKSFQQCEDLCFAFMQAASSKSQYLQEMIFLCIGLCEECATLAEEKMDDDFMHAAFHCRNFSNMLINLIPSENIQVSVQSSK